MKENRNANCSDNANSDRQDSVLAGTIRIKLNDEPIRTCREGESWFEEPSTHHLLAENNSKTEPAKLLAVFISNPGDPLKVDDGGKPDSLGLR